MELYEVYRKSDHFFFGKVFAQSQEEAAVLIARRRQMQPEEFEADLAHKPAKSQEDEFD